MSEKKEYAKVINGMVVEYPVSMDTIEQRKEPKTWYLPVIKDTAPSIKNIYQKVDLVFSVNQGYVKISYVVTAIPLELVLASFKVTEPGKDRKSISEIDLKQIKEVTTMISNHYEAKIEALVKERGYDSPNNLLGRYLFSSNEQYKAEATYIQKLLDDVWNALEIYFSSVQTEVLPVPVSISEIDVFVPSISWDRP